MSVGGHATTDTVNQAVNAADEINSAIENLSHLMSQFKPQQT